ncbi:MAG TPA: DUF1329 domain-containing protein [Nevskia sp.]|jgi:hypothetical protein|nr:DUF1329 domain-containing protein [Nevskia sp.]
MKFRLASAAALTTLAAALAAPSAPAAVSAEEAAQLGGDKLTCTGAERAGNADGSIPAYSGKWLGAPAGVDPKKTPGHDPDAYPDEKPLFTITAQNMAQYAERLSDGEKALFKRYPDTFRMPVYPSHRDFRYADWVCDVLKKNATTAQVIHDGVGVAATTGAVPFPIPRTGSELQWNLQLPTRAWTEVATYDQGAVYANGNIAWGRVSYKILAPVNDPKQRGSTTEVLGSYFNVMTLLPERDKGSINVGWTPNDYDHNYIHTWGYNPGTRRVREAPEFGYDLPQGAGGFRTVDDDRLLNGSPERYDWKIAGKRELYIPYDAWRLNDPKVKYADLLKTRGSINPDYMRYELHRVWVLQGDLKPGYRHLYKKRVIYMDEDTFHGVMADTYDGRGQLWRVGMVNYFYAYAMQAFHAGVSVYHDLSEGAYVADRLINEQPDGVRLNEGGLTPNDFTPDAARRGGH